MKLNLIAVCACVASAFLVHPSSLSPINRESEIVAVAAAVAGLQVISVYVPNGPLDRLDLH